jgi:hypothetical protein
MVRTKNHSGVPGEVTRHNSKIKDNIIAMIFIILRAPNRRFGDDEQVDDWFL